MKNLIVIPAFNCENQIHRVLSSIKSLAKADEHTVLVVDNRSSDGTLDAALASETPGGQIPFIVAKNLENYGLGGTQKVGFRFALEHGFEFVTILHGDDQGDISDLFETIRSTNLNTTDALLGARFAPGSTLRGYSTFRTFGNRVFNLLFSIICRKRIFDLGSGLNMYRTAMLRDGFYEKFTDDLTFNYCMILAHSELRHRIKFFPIHWSEDDQISNVKLISQTRRVLRLLLAYSLNRKQFMRDDHRAIARSAYPTEVIRRSRL